MYESTSSSPIPPPTFRIVRDEEPPPYDVAHDPRHAPGFGVIPAEVRALKSGECVAVYDAIASHANKNGEAWPSIQRLCELTGWSRKIVERSIARLIEAGILTKERRFTAGMKNSNLYRISAYGRIVPTVPTIVPTERLDSSHGTIGSSPQNHELYPEELDPEELEKISSRSPYSDEFETFWNLYPKGHGSKKAAFGQWRRMTADDRTAAVAAIPLFRAGRAWSDGYIKACERWLRDRLWENPPEPAPPKSNGRHPPSPPIVRGTEMPADGGLAEFRALQERGWAKQPG